MAEICTACQAALSELVAEDAPALTPGRLQDLQGLDRVDQVLRDLANVHDAGAADLADIGPITMPLAMAAARLDDTRQALSGLVSEDGADDEVDLF